MLIHGFGFCGEIFTPIIERYKDKYSSTIIDLPGHGKSDNIKNFADWIVAIQKIIPKNPILLGWSLGGLVALKLATQLSIKKVILCGSSPKFVNDDEWQYGIDTNNFLTFADNLKSNITKGLHRFISLQGLNKNQAKELKNIINNNLPTHSGLRNALDILLNADVRDEIKILQQTTTIEVYLGKKDVIVPISIADWYMQHNIKVAVLSGGHLPFLNEKFNI